MNRMSTTPATTPTKRSANHRPEEAPDALLLAEIEEQLIELARASAQRWQKMAVLLIDVEQNALWQGAARSYTAWVRDLASRAGVHESNLWRALKAGKFYNQVREQADAAAQTHAAQQADLEAAETELQRGKRESITVLPELPERPELPALGDLDSKASPESLALIERISRAAPPEKTAALVKNTLAGATTRKDLRIVWRDYRPAVQGNARGRARKGQDKVSPGLGDQGQAKVLAADILQALRADGGRFIDGRPHSKQWSVHTEVAVRPGTTRHARRIDAVCAEMETAEQTRPGFHAVEIKVTRSDLERDEKLTEYADFVDSLWLAVPETLAGEAPDLVPEWVGVIAYALHTPHQHDKPTLRVVQQADVIPRKADLRGEMAFELLKRLL